MLRAILKLFERAPGATLTPNAIAREIGVSPGALEHMLGTLVRSGRLVEVDECADCGACPLTRVCVGGLELRRRGYAVRVRGPRAPE